jgi:CRP/FNR family transcriptional regulator
MIERWTDLFPAFARLEPEARRALADSAREVIIPAATILFQDGTHCSAYLLVLEGSVRVQKVSESGREIVLYRVDKGQSCVLTTSCLMTREEYAAEGITETEVKALTIPAAAFRSLIAGSEAFRDFVFASYATRISDLLMLIEEVAFGRIESRLAQCLLAHRDGDGEIRATHQELAVELGTAREVVSRQLKEFERRGWVALQRGRLRVIDGAALAALCD